MLTSRHIALAALLIALGVALSIYPGSIPVGPVRVLPYQHMINVITGIMLGPWIGGGVALTIGLIRIGMGTGSIFAIPGGLPGVLIVGLTYKYLKKSPLVGLLEPLGTGIGALISAFIVAPAAGTRPLPAVFGFSEQWIAFLLSFWASSIPGTILGFLVVTGLAKRGIKLGA
jgi:energy coupling factor transporter S component ThiW